MPKALTERQKLAYTIREMEIQSLLETDSDSELETDIIHWFQNIELVTVVQRQKLRNEHTIGILKGRWASLREMRNQIRSPQEMEYLTQWVSACIVLHNLLAKIGDKWEELFSEEDAPEPAQELFPFDEENSSSAHLGWAEAGRAGKAGKGRAGKLDRAWSRRWSGQAGQAGAGLGLRLGWIQVLVGKSAGRRQGRQGGQAIGSGRQQAAGRRQVGRRRQQAAGRWAGNWLGRLGQAAGSRQRTGRAGSRQQAADRFGLVGSGRQQAAGRWSGDWLGQVGQAAGSRQVVGQAAGSRFGSVGSGRQQAAGRAGRWAGDRLGQWAGRAGSRFGSVGSGMQQAAGSGQVGRQSARAGRWAGRAGSRFGSVGSGRQQAAGRRQVGRRWARWAGDWLGQVGQAAGSRLAGRWAGRRAGRAGSRLVGRQSARSAWAGSRQQAGWEEDRIDEKLYLPWARPYAVPGGCSS
ncbi:hypothetical protein PPACK8108_LOCUS24172 [Phakopsora pachyrhizi]|uniref:DDE Tnp4 domain-containing protein n=1 Tax=Phakopsora pachyrhizi TaxID=170000 RepID=A0AAV0BP72_PHAPC|nr:hypothetical protein PPACK8108_LOCUS24172 [Phakopsora pachyrhizi]